MSLSLQEPQSDQETRIVRDVCQLWASNPDRTDEDRDRRIAAFAVIYDVPAIQIGIMTEGIWNKEQIARISITPAVKTALQIAYTAKSKHSFDFDTLDYIGKVNTRTKDDLVSIHLHRIFNLPKIWAYSPHAENFDKVARQFNVIANIINSQLMPAAPIPMAIAPKVRVPVKKTNFLRGLFVSPVTGDPITMDETSPPWMIALHRLLENGHTPEMIKDTDPRLYKQLADFHNKDMINIHGNRTCVYERDLIGYFAEQLYNRLRSRRDRVTGENITTLKFIKLGKPSYNHRTIEPRIGDHIVRCICIKNGKECGACFNLDDDASFVPCLKKIFENPPPGAVPKIDKLMSLIKNILEPTVESHRTRSVCPACEHINSANEEATTNLTGATPLLTHPSDVVCEMCSTAYCTDCFEHHPGVICNGFEKRNDTYGEGAQACPGCRSPTYRENGCTFIKCITPNCHQMWCWACRCLRYGENILGGRPEHQHYCMITPHYRSNPRWVNNPEFTPYISNAPLNADDPNGVYWVPP